MLDGIENLKRYYVVALLDPLNEHAVSRYVDPFWHAHILHTKEYIMFCDTIFKQYIHHQPLDFGNPDEVREIAMLYDYTKNIYQKIFSSINSQWWPDVSQAGFGHTIGPVVCRHMLIHDESIRNKALFSRANLLQVA